MLTTKQARAILKLSDKVSRAVDDFERKMSKGTPSDLSLLEHAKAYWLGALAMTARGQGYGSMPIYHAELTLEPRDPEDFNALLTSKEATRSIHPVKQAQ